MQVIYSDQPIEKMLNLSQHNIFLAGPTPRSKDVPSWRPDALTILKQIGYKGQVLVPEWKDGMAKVDYTFQVEWENYGLTSCSAVVFWVPRVIPTMAGMTTNVEFGRFVTNGKLNVFYGRPECAEKCRYLDWLYTKFYGRSTGRPIYTDLCNLLIAATR